jgi:hypothetical protein
MSSTLTGEVAAHEYFINRKGVGYDAFEKESKRRI